MENESLEITSEGDGDGWVRARNHAGEEGLIPHNYVEVGTTELLFTLHTTAERRDSFRTTTSRWVLHIHYTL